MHSDQRQTGDAPPARSVAGNVIRGSLGNLIEWYDWYAYAAFSIYFASVFFPSGNPTAQLLNTAGIFAVGFLIRPLGGWLFGRYADRYGRRAALTLSVTLMGVGSLGIAVLPGYAQIGALAPVLLVAARLLQGLSLGGEYGTSATYLSEVATPHRRGFYSSFQYVTLTSGQLLALGCPDHPAAAAHGGADACLGLADRVRHRSGGRGDRHVAAAHHGRVGELHAGRRESEHRTRQLAGPARLSAGMPDRGGPDPRRHHRLLHVHHVHAEVHDQHDRSAEGAGHVDQLRRAGHLRLPSAGVRRAVGSDRSPPLLIAFGIGATLCTVPLLTAVSRADSALSAFGLMMLGLVIVSGYTSINAVVKAELFPARIRALGVGLPYALTVAIFGGTTEYVALGLKNIGHETWFFFYVAGCGLISLLVYVFMGESSRSSQLERETRELHAGEARAGQSR